jgi:acyl carrier protein
VTLGNLTLAGTSDDDAFVDLGRAVSGVQLRIVDDADQQLSEGAIGRLQVKGETVTAGYYRNDEANREAFTEDGWFKTGDLAFLRQGRLTLTGREKDVIIVNGVNYYSHEVEALVEQIAGVKVSFTAACAVRDGNSSTDKLAIFLHATTGEADLPELVKRVRGQVVRNLGINPAYVIPVSQADIPKTSLGKIQRGQLQQRFRAGEFDELVRKLSAGPAAGVAPRNVVEEQLAAVWKEVLALPRISVQDSFFELGGHSLLATQLISRLQDLFHMEMPLARLFEAPTVEKLAQAMIAHEPAPGQTEKTARILKAIEALSAADVRRLLEQKRRQRIASPN